MLKKQLLKIFILILFWMTLFLTNKASATSIIFNSSRDVVGIGEQFYIDLMLSPEGDDINTITGNINFPDEYIDLLKIEEGRSFINLWVENPKLVSSSQINFAGVVSNGFTGVIDPFNPESKLPGLIFRMVFEAQKSGQANLIANNLSFNLNNGLGTEVLISDIKKSIDVGDFINKVKYENKSENAPQLEAYVVRDRNIFNNKYALIFKAFDKSSGIENVMIKEGRRDWEIIESPYLLKDQSRSSLITLKAKSLSGAVTTINIERMFSKSKLLAWVIIIGIMSVVLYLVIKRKYVIFKK